MARETTVDALLLPMMGRPSVDLPFCAVCGRTYPLNRHHVVRRGAGKAYDGSGRELRKPTVTLCGSGNASGCHGLAHSGRLHFRWVPSCGEQSRKSAVRDVWAGCGHWEFKVTEEPAKYQDALADDEGWRRLRSHGEEDD